MAPSSRAADDEDVDYVMAEKQQRSKLFLYADELELVKDLRKPLGLPTAFVSALV